MAAEVLQPLDELDHLSEDVHWFCPRTGDEQYFYFEEDLLTTSSDVHANESVRQTGISAAEHRRDTALKGCQIFAFDGEDAAPYRNKFLAQLKTQLGRCDICIREYHRSRGLLQQRLDSQYEVDEVRLFMEMFDAMNIKRIGEGLNSMTLKLSELPEAKRNLKSGGDEGMYALFEALHCLPLLKDEGALQKYFDRPWTYLTSPKNKIKLPSYAPAMGAFVFSQNNPRSAWALKGFSSIERPMTGAEFEHSVRPFFELALARININSLEKQFLPTFWRGTRAIVAKLTKGLVSNNIRAMESNLYEIGLEHFQIDETHFSDLLASFQILLRLSPADFWNALQHASAQAVVETILRSPVLQKMLKMTDEREPLHLEERMQWTVLFVKTIKPTNLVPPVKIILDQLLHHIQSDQYSRYARTVCWQTGLTCLLTALSMMKEHVKSGPTVTHMLQLLSTDHIRLVMNELDGIEKKTEIQIEKTEQICLDIVERALALDLAGLIHNRDTIEKKKSLENELGISNLEIWKMSMRHVRPGQPSLVNSILSGIQNLLQLELLPPNRIRASPKPAELFNQALKRVHNFVCNDFLERLDSWSADQLDELFMLPTASQGLMNLLFNGESRVQHAALNVLKSLSGQDDRRGSVMHVVSALYTPTLPSINKALLKVSSLERFGPCSFAMKICTDVFSSLCDSQDGLLRSKKFPEDALRTLETFWERVWGLLGVIFGQTEAWSNLGYDKQVMQDFCRETMDFADIAFGQYAIIASTLQAASKASATDVRKRLLKSPNEQFESISKWLRLRDDYLVTKAVGLTCKILGRLREVGIRIGPEPAYFIEKVVTTNVNIKTKTNLQSNQKAELQSALENHLGESISEVITIDDTAAKPKKQSNLQDWASSRPSSGASTPVSTTGKASRPGTIDVDAWSDAAKRKKEIESARDKQKTIEPQKKPSATPATAKAAQKHQEDQKSFLLKRQKEKEEADRRKAAALAKAKGVGVGSGVNGLGDMGKDHSMKGQNVMVSSDEDSDDDDDMDMDLFGETKKKIYRPDVNPNGAVGLKPEQKAGPTKIRRAQRSLKDQRARLAPDLSPLHRVILKWDFFHTGDYPPGANEYQFKGVANSFTDPTTYRDTFQPLLTLEAWQGMVKAREENSGKPYEVKIQNRTNVDAFIELSSFIGSAENREIQVMEGDIILLSKVKNATQDESAPHCLARVYRLKRQKAHIEVVYQVLPGSSLAPSLTQQAMVWGVKVQSITPLEREYGALEALQYYDLCNQIIKAKPSKRLEFGKKQINAYQDIWNVNQAQSEAINAALTNEGFSLIQGPPGSGKTKTIIAIVGGLLTHSLSQGTAATKISMPKAAGILNTGNDAPPKKLLVCAPSNAAVDELVMRLKEGVKTKTGILHQLNIVRIGRSEAINQQVLDVTMEELVAKKLGPNENDQRVRERNAELFKEHEKISGQLKELHQKRDKGDVSGKALTDLEAEIDTLRKRKRELGVRIDNAKDAERNAGREAELNRKRAQQAVLDEAHVICATLSGSGHDMFQSLNIDLETVVIDEAAQCVEMSSLIPLKYGCVKCIMVGDPKQLPPTVFSKEAAKFQYEQSLFVRMQNNFPGEVHLLDTQYRMHPEISIFPSRTFYDGLLQDGLGMAGLRQRPWHKSALLAPYRFYDVAGQQQSAVKGHSLINMAEVEVAMALYSRLLEDYKTYDFTANIGIITPYKSQLSTLKNRFVGRFGNDVFNYVEFNTTDAFQGRESEIIIFSCVRASPAGGIGFLQDIRRMNVGLTRAKSSLWVLGNSASLVRGQFWKKLVEDAQARDCYTTGDVKSMLSQPSSKFPASTTNSSSMLDVGSHVHQMDVGASSNGSRPHTPGLNVVPKSTRSNEPTFREIDVPQQSDRMEGVQYRFQDRIVAKTESGSETGSGRSTPHLPDDAKSSKSVGSEDVQMVNAADDVRRSATPGGIHPMAETASSTDETRVNQANGSVKPGPDYMAPSVPQLKKRPAASPFMPPRKQARPRPPQ